MKPINIMYFFSHLEEFIEKRKNLENYDDPEEVMIIVLLANLAKLVMNRECGIDEKKRILEVSKFNYESIVALMMGREIEKRKERYDRYIKYFDRFGEEDIEKVMRYTEIDDLRQWMRETFTGVLFLPGGLKRKPSKPYI